MSTNTTQHEALWASPQLAAYLDVPEGTLDQWAYLGKGPAFLKVGRHRRYRPEDVQRWLDSCRSDSAPALELRGTSRAVMTRGAHQS